jgi:hypothetical protein
MAIVQGMTNSFKTQLLKGLHDFSASGGHTFKIALYTEDADLDASTTDYTSGNEVSGSGYTAGGATLVNVDPTANANIAYTSFSSVSWSAPGLTARAALIYNTTLGGGSGTTDSVAVLDFGLPRTATTTFSIIFPTADATSAIIRIT